MSNDEKRDSQKVTVAVDLLSRTNPASDALIDDDSPFGDSEATVVTDAPDIKPELLPKGLGSRLVASDQALSAMEILKRKGLDALPYSPPATSAPRPPVPAIKSLATEPAATPRRSEAVPSDSRMKRLIAIGVAAALVLVAAVGLIGYLIGRSGAR